MCRKNINPYNEKILEKDQMTTNIEARNDNEQRGKKIQDLETTHHS